MSSVLTALAQEMLNLFRISWQYATLISLANVIVSLTAVLVLRNLNQQLVKQQRWIAYLARAYACFTVLYTVRLLSSALGTDHKSAVLTTNILCYVGVGPILNVYLFRATVSIRPPARSRFPDSGWLALAIWVASAVGGLGEVLEWGAPFHRLTSTLIPAGLLAWFGVGMFTSITVVRRRAVARFAFAGAIVYALLHVFYAFAPYLLQVEPWRRVVNDLLSSGGQPLVDGGGVEAISIVDGAVFLVASAMKLALFVGAMALAIRNMIVISPRQMNAALQDIIERRVEALSDKGLLRAIGSTMGADLVAVCYPLPGRPGCVAWWRWLANPSARRPGGLDETDLKTLGPSVMATVLAEGRVIQSRDRNQDHPDLYYPYIDSLNSFIAVPIRYHGAVIGALNVEWRQIGYDTQAMYHRVRGVADLLAAAVNSNRQMVALNQLSDRLSKVELQDGRTDRASGLQHVNSQIYQVLSPLGCAIVLDIGFGAESSGTMLADGTGPQDVSASGGAVREKVWARLGEGDRDVREVDLKAYGTKIGSLVFSVRRDGDDLGRATLVDDRANVDAAAAIAADALMDLSRLRFGTILRALNERLLRSSTPSLGEWFGAISATADAMRCAWVVAELPDQWLGTDEAVLVVKARNSTWKLSAEVVTSEAIDSIVGPDDASREARRLIRLRLEEDTFLWLGVAKKDLDAELRPGWPWRMFLESLSSAASSYLKKLTVERMRFEEAQSYALLMAAVTTGSFVHEILGITARVQHTVDNAVQLLKLRVVAQDQVRAIVSGVAKEVGKLAEHTQALTGIVKVETERPCSLRSAVERAVSLFAVVRDECSIAVDSSGVPASALVDVPLSVAYLAIANLVSNSIRAIGVAGTVSIVAQARMGRVLCMIEDTGKGVSPNVASQLFAPNVSTAKAGHGIGLYLTKRSLASHGAQIRLVRTSSTGTLFEIDFPASGAEALEEA